jgi:hypothetical protein
MSDRVLLRDGASERSSIMPRASREMGARVPPPTMTNLIIPMARVLEPPATFPPRVPMITLSIAHEVDKTRQIACMMLADGCANSLHQLSGRDVGGYHC